MLQHLSKRSTKILLELYNSVWSEGKMPQNWRHFTVKPGKDPQAISSYRPISLTSTIGRIVFDSRLTWNDHVNYVVEKCKNALICYVQSRVIAGEQTKRPY